VANRQLTNFLEQQRVDVPDLQALQSSVVFDFQDLLTDFLGQTPYILQGYTIPVASAFSNPASALQVVVDSSVVWMPTDPNGAFLTTPAGTPNEVLSPNNPKVTGSFAASSTNYLSVIFSRTTDPATSDLVSFWDVDSNQEYTATVPRGIVLNYQFVISTSGFGTGSPIAIIVTDSANIPTSITNAKQELFRLGTGGTSPNPFNSYTLSLDPENPLTSTSGSVDPFAGGDHQLKTWKNWMDLVMTRLKEIANSFYWYSDSGAPVPGVNLADLFFDTDSSVITGVGTFIHSEATPGMLTWSSDINIRSIMGPLTYIIPPGTVTLSDSQVAYIELVRNYNFQPSNVFTFASGSTTITATATVTGIAAGDWIKLASQNILAWTQVASVSGNMITLSSGYNGASGAGLAYMSQGTYTMQVASPENVPVSSNTFWMAKRDDNAVPSSVIASIGASGATRTSEIATVTTTTPHNLVAGQTVSITGVSDSTFDGTYTLVSIPTTTSFTYINEGSNVPASTAGGGAVATIAKIYLRALGELDQGEERQIDDVAIQNILQFIGSQSETSITPPYTILPNGLSPYSFTTNNNLTEAISAITGNVNELYDVLAEPSYEEFTNILTTTASGSILDLPANSRVAGFPQQYYVVGNGALQLFLNGQYWQRGASPGGWSEVGSTGSSSYQIQINENLVNGDTVTFRIDTTGGAAPGGSGGGVPSVNGITSAVTITAGTNVTVSTVGPTITISSTGGGSSILQVNSYSSNHTANISTDDVLEVDCTSGPVTITLPSSGATGKRFYISKIDSSSNACIINGAPNLINGSSTFTLPSQYDSLTVCGVLSSNWRIL